MEQLLLFHSSNTARATAINESKIVWSLFVDGASRNNPGLSGAGIFIVKNEIPLLKEGFFLGKKTNNQAEYLALLVGLYFLQQYATSSDKIIIVSDSQLLVRQILGEYKMRNAQLLPLFNLVKKLLLNVQYTIKHVLRDQNKEADSMANKGVDFRYPLPEQFIMLLNNHDVHI